MRILFTKVLFLISLASLQSWASEIDGKYLNCKCKSNSQNCIDDFDAKGNEKNIAFRKQETFRIFSIAFNDGKVLRFYPVENDKSDGIFITATSIDNPPTYSTTMDQILFSFQKNSLNLETETTINRATLIYKEQWVMKINGGFKVWFSSVATCEPGDSMLVFELQNILQEQYEKIKSKNKF